MARLEKNPLDKEIVFSSMNKTISVVNNHYARSFFAPTKRKFVLHTKEEIELALANKVQIFSEEIKLANDSIREILFVYVSFEDIVEYCKKK